MADLPIIFSAPMVKALLAGTKSQTRRVSGLSDVNERPRAWTLNNVGPLGYMAKSSARGKFGATFESREIEPRTLTVCPQRLPYAVGDRLWVREAWASISEPLHRAEDIIYRADPGNADWAHGWGSPRFMPRWASRLTLTVTAVRVQRLGEISEEDAIAEGIARGGAMGMWGWWDYGHDEKRLGRRFYGDPRESFRTLWESLHGAGSWAVSPWVVAYTFETRRGNIDA